MNTHRQSPAVKSMVEQIGAMLDELVSFARKYGAPCFVGWPDNILREYFAFHAQHGSLAVVRDTVFPEARETLEHQFRWLLAGKRRAVLVVGDQLIFKLEGVESIEHPEGRLYFKDISKEEVEGFLKRDELGLLLGYGIPRKPAAGGGCVVIRDKNGIEKQAVVVDSESLPIVWESSRSLTSPTDRLQCESFEDVLYHRQLAGAPLPEILGIGIGWQVNEPEIEKHWCITDPKGDSFYFAHCIAVSPAALPIVVAEWQRRIPCWSKLKLFCRRNGTLRRFTPRHLERLGHVAFKH